jgi:hypothetical protein
MLTGISIWDYTPSLRWPVSLRQGGLVRVRDLSVDANDGELLCYQVVHLLTRLESLVVLCQDTCASRGFMSYPPLMPYLTKFCAEDSHRCVRTRPLAVHVSALFLQRFPVLRHLELDAGVLVLEQWDHDVKYIGALTGLTTLMISHLDGSRYNGQENRLTFEEVKPLTTLRLLDSIQASGPLAHAIGSPEFREAMDSMRHVMGLPRTSIKIFP